MGSTPIASTNLRFFDESWFVEITQATIGKPAS